MRTRRESISCSASVIEGAAAQRDGSTPTSSAWLVRYRSGGMNAPEGDRSYALHEIHDGAEELRLRSNFFTSSSGDSRRSRAGATLGRV